MKAALVKPSFDDANVTDNDAPPRISLHVRSLFKALQSYGMEANTLFQNLPTGQSRAEINEINERDGRTWHKSKMS